jgi:hypothetical protein
MAEPPKKDKKQDANERVPEHDSFDNNGSDTFENSPTPTFTPEPPRPAKNTTKEKKDKSRDDSVTSMNSGTVGVSTLTIQGTSSSEIRLPVGVSGTFVIRAQTVPTGTSWNVGQPTNNGGTLPSLATLDSSDTSTNDATFTISVPGNVKGQKNFEVSADDTKSLTVAVVGIASVSANVVVMGTSETRTVVVYSDPPNAKFPLNQPKAQVAVSAPGVLSIFGTFSHAPFGGSATLTLKAGSITGIATVTISCGTDVITVAFTVLGANGNIVATVPSTPPLTERTGTFANQWSSPANLTFTVTNRIQTAGTTFTFDAAQTFAQTRALVLAQNSAANIPIAVTVNPPDTDLTFKVYRARDDAAAIGVSIPTVNKTGATTATVGTDAVGSFHIFAFVDSNQSGNWDVNEFGFTMPLVLAGATAGPTDQNQVHSDQLVPFFNDNAGFQFWQFAGVRAGKFPPPQTNVPGAIFDNEITLIGGGTDGRRGLDRVFLGWINNVTQMEAGGRYQLAANVRETAYIFAANGPATPVTAFNNSLRVFVDPPVSPLPDIISPLPLQDTGRSANPQGGIEATLTRSPNDGRGIVTNLVLGEKRRITASDAPQFLFQRNHPSNATLELNNIKWDLKFTTRLAIWTNTIANPSPTPTQNTVGYRTFSIAAEIPWKISGEWNIVPGPNFTFAPVGMPTIQFDGALETHSPPVPGAGRMEIRRPTFLNTVALDAQQ